MKILAALFALACVLAFFRRRREDDTVSVEAIATYEAKLRLGEPLPQADEQELRRVRTAWERRRGSRGNVAAFHRSAREVRNLWRVS